MMALLLALMLMIPCAVAEDSPAARYEAAAALMIAGDNAGAAAVFTALSGYMDAPFMAIYCQALAWRQAGEHALAAETFGLIPGFKDADMQAACSRGMAEEAAAEAALVAKGPDVKAALAHLQAALDHYEPLMALPTVSARADACRTRMAEIEARAVDGVKAGSDGMYIITRDGLQGVMNSQGEIVIPCQWKRVYAAGNGAAMVEDESGVGIISLTGEVLVPLSEGRRGGNLLRRKGADGEWETAGVDYKNRQVRRWDGSVLYLDSGWQTVRGEEGYGLMDAQGKMIVPCRYEKIIIREKVGYVAALPEKGVYDCYTLSGEPVALPAGMYLALNVDGDYPDWETGFAVSRQQDDRTVTRVWDPRGDFSFEAMGFVDVYRVYEWVYPEMYGESDVVPGLYRARVSYTDEDGLRHIDVYILDEKGGVIFREPDSEFCWLVEGRWLLTSQGWGGDRIRIRDLQTGAYADVHCVTDLAMLDDGFFVHWYLGDGVFLTNDLGVYDLQGRMLLDPREAILVGCADGLLAYRQKADDMCGVMNAQGDEMLPATWKNVMFCGDVILVQEADGFWKKLNRDDAVVPRRGSYSSVEQLSDGLVAVRSGVGLWGVIDGTGREILPMAYEDVTLKGGAILQAHSQDGSVLLTDLTGRELLAVQPDDVVVIGDGSVACLRNGLLTIVPVD